MGLRGFVSSEALGGELYKLENTDTTATENPFKAALRTVTTKIHNRKNRELTPLCFGKTYKLFLDFYIDIFLRLWKQRYHFSLLKYWDLEKSNQQKKIVFFIHNFMGSNVEVTSNCLLQIKKDVSYFTAWLKKQEAGKYA